MPNKPRVTGANVGMPQGPKASSASTACRGGRARCREDRASITTSFIDDVRAMMVGLRLKRSARRPAGDAKVTAYTRRRANAVTFEGRWSLQDDVDRREGQDAGDQIALPVRRERLRLAVMAQFDIGAPTRADPERLRGEDPRGSTSGECAARQRGHRLEHLLEDVKEGLAACRRVPARRRRGFVRSSNVRRLGRPREQSTARRGLPRTPVVTGIPITSAPAREPVVGGREKAPACSRSPGEATSIAGARRQQAEQAGDVEGGHRDDARSGVRAGQASKANHREIASLDATGSPLHLHATHARASL